MTTLKGTLVGTLGICIVCGGAFGALADATATTEIPTEAGIALQESLSGHWRAAETKVQEEQRHDAIDHVTEDMGRFKRGKARGRLKEQTSPPAELVIRMTDSTVTLNAGDQHIEFELGGDPIEIEGRNGSSSTTAKVSWASTHLNRPTRTITCNPTTASPCPHLALTGSSSTR